MRTNNSLGNRSQSLDRTASSAFKQRTLVHFSCSSVTKEISSDKITQQLFKYQFVNILLNIKLLNQNNCMNFLKNH